MKKSFIIIILFSISLFAQKPADSLLTTFYNITLENIFSDSLSLAFPKDGKTLFIKIDSDSTRLIKNVGKYKIRFFSVDDDLSRIIKKPYKKSSGMPIYNLSYKFSNDTVDVIINGKTLTLINRRSFFLSSWCRGGGYGYIPEGRRGFKTSMQQRSFL